MKTYKELQESSSDYVIYHNTLTACVQEMEKYATKKGYHLDKEEMADEIGMGPAKPKSGNTNKYTLTLYKNDVNQKKAIHFQVYNRGVKSGNEYELNVYIS